MQGKQGAQELANQRRRLQDEQATLTLQQAELKADEDELRVQRLQLEADQKANAETLQVGFCLLLCAANLWKQTMSRQFTNMFKCYISKTLLRTIPFCSELRKRAWRDSHSSPSCRLC